MAYRQKAPKQDIRDLPLKKLPKTLRSRSTKEKEVTASSPAAETLPLFYAPKAELVRVGIISAALILILAIGMYLELTRHWVIPFANWLLSIGY